MLGVAASQAKGAAGLRGLAKGCSQYIHILGVALGLSRHSLLRTLNLHRGFGQQLLEPGTGSPSLKAKCPSLCVQ